MGSTSGTIVAILIGFIATLGIAFGLLYAASMGFPLTGPGLIPGSVAASFLTADILTQLQMVYTNFLLNILEVYILAPIVWLLGGLIGGFIARDLTRGAAAGLIAAIIAPFFTLVISWVMTSSLDYNLLLWWVINGILGGIIAAVGGIIGGTLTSQIETR
ncbi:MAG: hypothetical protein ACFE89_06625 [Candidatus Hodarchaeota archaeon]